MDRKPIRRELALLWKYIREVREYWKGLLGALAVIAAIGIAGWLLPQILPHLPVAVAVWLSGRRLTAMGAIALLAVAQYLAWRKQYLANRPEGPEVDERLELHEEVPGLSGAPSDTIKEMAKALQVFIDPRPAFTLFAHFMVRKQIDTPILYLECTAPIYRVIGRYRKPDFGEQVGAEPIRNLQERAWVQFGDAPLSAGATLSVVLYSSVPFRLKRVVPCAPPPADPPSPKASA